VTGVGEFLVEPRGAEGELRGARPDGDPRDLGPPVSTTATLEFWTLRSCGWVPWGAAGASVTTQEGSALAVTGPDTPTIADLAAAHGMLGPS
jgi:hypothetical protein